MCEFSWSQGRVAMATAGAPRPARRLSALIEIYSSLRIANGESTPLVFFSRTLFYYRHTREGIRSEAD